MKKIWLMWLTVCAVCAFSACSDDDDNNPATTDPVIPVTEIKVPATAEIGKEISVTGKGFAKEAQLYLQSEEGEDVEVDAAEFSASGVTFKIPMSLEAGKYTLILLQQGRWELGEITLTAASLPVFGLEIPDEGLIGKKLTIVGSGFNTTSKVFLEDAAGARTELSEPDVTNGFVAKIPAEVSAGTYKLVLTQDGGEWILKEEIKVVAAPVIKRLVGIKHINSTTVTDYSPLASLSEEELLENFGVSSVEEFQEMYEPYFAGTAEEDMTLVYENGLLKEAKQNGESKYMFTSTESQIVGENLTWDGYDETFAFTLNLENGRVENSTAQYKPEQEAKSYKWEYDENGNWTRIAFATTDKDYTTYNFRDGNFIAVDEEDLFEYAQSEWKNNSYGIDMALLIYMLSSDTEESELFAVLLGLCGTPSVNLPSASFITGSPLPLAYEYDEDGYVTSASMVGSGLDSMLDMLPVELSDRYEFVYEVVDYE